MPADADPGTLAYQSGDHLELAAHSTDIVQRLCASRAKSNVVCVFHSHLQS